MKARHGFGPVGHHLQLPVALGDRGRREARGRAGGQRSRAGQNIPPSHGCSLSPMPDQARLRLFM